MRKRGLWGYAKFIVVASIVTVFIGSSAAFATTSTSSHYSLDDAGFSSGTTAQTCSSSYCSQSSLGTVSSGDTSSTNDTANIGNATQSEPDLSVIVDGGSTDLGVLTAETTATKVMTVKVKDYLSEGYVLQISGDAPHYDGHYLTALTTPTLSTPGTEQFGLNAVANSAPDVGADPVQVPSTNTSFGYAVTGYNTANYFKYVSGDTIAQSPKSSGETDFTISMIFNISNSTPAGEYGADFSAVVVPVY